MVYIFFTILPFMVCLFWTAVFVLDWRTAIPAKRLLTGFLATCTLLYLCHAVFFNGECATPLANCVYAFCNLAVFPLYYLYICRLTELRKISLKIYLHLFAPAVIVGIWAILNATLLKGNAASEDFRLFIAKVLFFLQVIPVCCYGFIKLKSFDQKIENYYSDLEYRSVKPIRVIMLIIVVCSMCSVTVNHLGREYFLHNIQMLIIPSILFSSLLFSIGYVGMKQEFSIDNLEEETKTEEKETELSEENSRLLEKLTTLMSEERMYLKPDLRLSDVAKELKVSRTILSAFINQTIGSSFSDYINTLRIKHAQTVMLNDIENRLSMQGVYEMSGFTSESSFYRSFRKVAGMTPKEWNKKIRQN